MTTIPIVDVFAGPGGLNEGFSSLLDRGGTPIFRTVNSFEMNDAAVNTLRLRAALRTIRRDSGGNPESYYRLLREGHSFPAFEDLPELSAALKDADDEVRKIVLGEGTRDESDAIIRESLGNAGDGPWVLVGGPPCQAYSLAGRSRRTNDPTFVDDHKHVLYREYLHILAEHRPTVFVMENVKGMLSSRHDGGSIFQKILVDLRSPAKNLEYEIRSFALRGTNPRDFILRAEGYGVPQRRHRVILLGVLKGSGLGSQDLLSWSDPIPVEEALAGIPAIRPMISPRSWDSKDLFLEARAAARELSGHRGSDKCPPLGCAFIATKDTATEHVPGDLGDWLEDPKLGGVIQHESRAHMTEDLVRYGYLSAKALAGEFPKVNELPNGLIPNHKNAAREDAPFSDRFRVQRSDLPSTTVVSHIAKDGHYYIHPDPDQMRSLSVREAARLQTFPDDYYFTGSRTEQYHQVGNAVPPLLARKLGAVIAKLLGREVGPGQL